MEFWALEAEANYMPGLPVELIIGTGFFSTQRGMQRDATDCKLLVINQIPLINSL